MAQTSFRKPSAGEEHWMRQRDQELLRELRSRLPWHAKAASHFGEARQTTARESISSSEQFPNVLARFVTKAGQPIVHIKHAKGASLVVTKQGAGAIHAPKGPSQLPHLEELVRAALKAHKVLLTHG
ncbi:hypothetical protein HY571_00540 [Candidatus Micrarchaeota archaeon]|nr:hypothetical protein [Candidatus Micrarchaeota archaeon]